MKVADIKAAQEAGTHLLYCRDTDWSEHIRGYRIKVIDPKLAHWYRAKSTGEWMPSDYPIGGTSLFSNISKKGVLVQRVYDLGEVGSYEVASLASLRGPFDECRAEQDKAAKLKQEMQSKRNALMQRRAEAQQVLGQKYGVQFGIQDGRVVIDPVALVGLLETLSAGKN